jgi:hypothetical protein
MKSIFISLFVFLLSFSAFALSPFALSPPPKDVLGIINPNVTQSNIKVTICKVGWSDAQRPGLGWVHRLKVRQLKVLGIPATEASKYWEDHVVPISVGGAPKALGNLQPQLIADAK